jgi:hypothetical protein
MRCLREKELVWLHEGEGTPAARDHLGTCLRCAARYRGLADDLRVIGAVLESDPAPAAAPHRAVRLRVLAAAAAVCALVIGLNLLFAREWGSMATRQSLAPAGAGGGVTEELIAAVEAMSAGEPPAVEAAATVALAPGGGPTPEASAAELYAAVAGEEACESPTALPEDGCGQTLAPADTPGAGFADVDS